MADLMHFGVTLESHRHRIYNGLLATRGTSISDWLVWLSEPVQTPLLRGISLFILMIF